MNKNIYKLELIWPIEYSKLNQILNSSMHKIYCIYQENKEYYLETNTKELAIKLQKYEMAKLVNN